MKRESKIRQVEELNHLFSRHNSFFVVNFQGLNVAQITRLRKLLRRQGGEFKVVKNRLALRALRPEFPPKIREFFQRPTALVFPDGDAIALARLLREFSLENKSFQVKGGMIEGQVFPGEQLEEICRLGSRHELLAKIGYLLAFPLFNFIRTWQAPLVHFGLLLNQ